MIIFQKISVVAIVVAVVIGLSFFTLTNPNSNNAFAQQQNNGFDKELNLLNQSLGALENQDKNAKKMLFDAEGMVEDKIKDNPEIGNAEKRIEAAIKMVGEDNFQAAIDHTKEAIKTFSDLN
ncbi:MAG TPA: hypothetical protein VFM31_08825 [Nitrososphaeraceae archaeon]|nr:hypothetical protein [Nitrososphaeraceae archaeon]